MKLYHGTPRKNAEDIEMNGFIPSENAGFTPVDAKEEVVFFTDTIEGAMEYGDVVFEIESEGYEVFYQVCPFAHIKEYYINVEKVNNELIYNRI